ncbi:hypothetical protein OWR29_35420 [Actinoplanes sp. Pm04-4]|uniref:IucA/IucC family protein n=1 Tax=Paractinoplanes pyxinae TaxID=2997416 RepID=A0ABT4B9X7_9ACTN|nr:IucA/IucC family protein [Actinoplanes pyxinae]MCY1143316.1 hypothetical protein [Actinoplanes pyxinae]
MPRSSGSAPPHRHTAGPLRTREELAVLRPELVARYDAELAGARAAVLARLLGALDREPLPGLISRRSGEATFAPAQGSGLVSVRYPIRAARPFAVVDPGLATSIMSSPDNAANELGAGSGSEDFTATPTDRLGAASGSEVSASTPADRLDAGLTRQDSAASAAYRLGAAGGRKNAAGNAAGRLGAGLGGEDAAGSTASLTDAADAANTSSATQPGNATDAGYAALNSAATTNTGPADHGASTTNSSDAPHAADAANTSSTTQRGNAADAGYAAVTMTGGANRRASATDFSDATKTGGDGDAGGVTRSVVDPGELVRLLWGDVPLAEEIDNSVANMALARAARHDQQLPEPGDPDALGRIEQLVTDGHPLHPCCRTRGGMSVADVLAYAPEHSPVIRLQRLRVPRDRWYGTAAPILFAHPWQAARLAADYPWLVPDGESDPVRPLMSLRTVAPVDGGPHIKTAVDVQMTSAVRTVSPAAVHNGPVLSRLLRRLTADLPIEILAEIAAGAVIVDGVPQRHLAHVIREAPQLKPGELAVPLAALAALPVRLDDPYGWWERFCDLFFGPITRVLARGVALEAHGQNALVVLEDGRPTRILYRDLGGVRVSAARLRASGIEPPALLGDLPSDDPAELRTKLAAAAFGTVAAELIAMLTRTRNSDPDRLWGMVARAVRATGSEDVPHLLRDPLPIKATTAMRLASDPLDDLWAHVPNPMAAHA